jgi:hypothetical protein
MNTQTVPPNEATTEAMIQKAGLAGRRLSPADIDAVIEREEFTILPNSCTTICEIFLKNGYTVTGKSACVSPENFNEEIGRKVARENARKEIWPLEGYRLKEACFRGRELEAY